MEEWKNIIDYEGIYEASNLGNIKSLSRAVLRNGKFPFISKERILKKSIDGGGYNVVSLYKNGKQNTSKVHQLVAESFLNHFSSGHDIVINHINFIKTDNRVENLEIVTARENSNLKHKESSSKYVGVSLDKKSKKWISYITIKKSRIVLGYFTSELEASQKYENALNSLNNGLEIKSNCKKVDKTSKYIGVGFHKASGKYRSRIVIEGKSKTIGYFTNEIDAYKAYQDYSKNYSYINR